MEISTEEKILAAAENIFLRDGYGGSRMQDIADLAGINKAMLHYYFRSKDKLFEKIFDKNVKMVFPQIAGLITDSMSFQEVVFVFIEKY
ncbi:MAG: helix-turn-helix domain-containing protein, partial [Bacteroidota bacterium]